MTDNVTLDQSCLVFRVSWQDYRGHVPGVGMKKPPVRFRDFGNMEDALRFKEKKKQQLPHAIACITKEGGKPYRPVAARGDQTRRCQ